MQGPANTVAAYICADNAHLELQRCTVALTGSGRWQVQRTPHPVSQTICGVMMGGCDPANSTNVASLSMSDCSFSCQLPDTTAKIKAGIWPRAVMANPGSQFEATRCTFNGVGLMVNIDSTVRMTDCTMQDDTHDNEPRHCWTGIHSV